MPQIFFNLLKIFTLGVKFALGGNYPNCNLFAGVNFVYSTPLPNLLLGLNFLGGNLNFIKYLVLKMREKRAKKNFIIDFLFWGGGIYPPKIVWGGVNTPS